MGRPGTPGGRPPATERPEAPVATRDATNPNPRAAGRSLGVSAEPVTIGQRTGMKVIGVHPDSPAQKAGIEVGDVIVAANGVAITGAESLSAVVRKSGASLSLSVRDTRTGKDTPVEVKLGGEEAGHCRQRPGRSTCDRRVRPATWRRHRTGVLRRRPGRQGDRSRARRSCGQGRDRARRRDRRGQRRRRCFIPRTSRTLSARAAQPSN